MRSRKHPTGLTLTENECSGPFLFQFQEFVDTAHVPRISIDGDKSRDGFSSTSIILGSQTGAEALFATVGGRIEITEHPKDLGQVAIGIGENGIGVVGFHRPVNGTAEPVPRLSWLTLKGLKNGENAHTGRRNGLSGIILGIAP